MSARIDRRVLIALAGAAWPIATPVYGGLAQVGRPTEGGTDGYI